MKITSIKEGQKLFHVHRIIPDDFDWAPVVVYKIYKNGKVRVKYYDENGKELNDFIVKPCDLYTRKGAIGAIRRISQSLLNSIHKEFSKRANDLQKNRITNIMKVLKVKH